MGLKFHSSKTGSAQPVVSLEETVTNADVWLYQSLGVCVLSPNDNKLQWSRTQGFYLNKKKRSLFYINTGNAGQINICCQIKV